MRVLKSLLAIVLALTVAGSLVACGQNETSSTDDTTGETTAPTLGPIKPAETEEEKAIIQQRRDTVEAHMRESVTLLWRPTENLTYGLAARDNGTTLALKAGRLYQGMPYAYAVGTQDSFLDYAGEPDENGIYTISGLDATALNYESYGARVGNDCSGAVTNAWSQVGTSFTASMSSQMFEKNGVIAVGDYDFTPTIDPESGRVYETATTLAKNGPATMFKAYAQLQKGDAVVAQYTDASNHTMMIVSVDVVYNGDNIDTKQSTVTVLEQTRKIFKSGETYIHPEFQELVYVIGGVDKVYTFEYLYNKSYLPVTIRELVDPSPVDEPWVKDTVETPTKDNIFTGNITSNWYIDCVTVTITDGTGNVVQKVTGRAKRQFNKDFEMERFVTENPGACKGSVDVTTLESGSYHCTVTAKLTTGKELTVRDFDFTV